MKLRYQTSIGTLVQFLWLAILGAPNALVSIISTCHTNGSDCVSNLLVSLIFYLLTTAYFGFIWVLGYFAQDKRSRKLAVILIGFEFVTLVVAGHFNFPKDTNYLAKFTSATDALLSIWVIYLAFNLIRAKGGRVVKSSVRPRKRRHPNA